MTEHSLSLLSSDSISLQELFQDLLPEAFLQQIQTDNAIRRNNSFTRPW